MRMEQPRHSKTNGWIVLIPIMAVLALLAFGIGNASTKTRLYFFDKTGQKLVDESRVIPLVGSIETRALAVLEELLLGPAEPGHIAILPLGTSIHAVFHRDNRLVVSLSLESFHEIPFDFPKIREAFVKTLASGIPGYGTLELYINGSATQK